MLTKIISLASCQVDVFDSATFSLVQMVVKSVIILTLDVQETEHIFRDFIIIFSYLHVSYWYYSYRII